ncbi:hypothetical protein CSB93_6272 [Pseudomonas paraeruginosa]|uniref:Uncharacterized protein n=1 Tax=Pseudomonas paraeruginosa TaxID=2994495 RepID=A0A2R3IS91_9PSED|nr:hypothetical protein CSB93_6272 [Pseudomonas paraeruginosa]AWE93963.1 hypothetical protein CSC28_5075 [Pseudomonas paraeruginosa]
MRIGARQGNSGHSGKPRRSSCRYSAHPARILLRTLCAAETSPWRKARTND